MHIYWEKFDQRLSHVDCKIKSGSGKERVIIVFLTKYMN